MRIMKISYTKKHTGYKINGKRSVCWITDHCLHWDGYAKCSKRNHLGEDRTHRYMYRKYCCGGRKLQKGVQVHHKCDCKPCIRPSHLKALTPKAHSAETHKLDPSLKKRIALGIKKAFKCDLNIQAAKRKLTDKQVLKIRKLYDNGYKYYEIAERIGCERASVRLICLGRTYKHLL